MSRSAVLEKLKSSAPVIAPSMLKCDFGNLHREIELLEAAGAQVLHLDVMDGHFVPNLSYGPMIIERMRERTELPFDAHLMISDPDRYLDDYLKAGCDCITFHVEAVPDPIPLLRRIREADAAAGLALNPRTPVAAVESALEECDLVLVMSVEPGFGGQAFDPVALDKLRTIQEWAGSNVVLSVDGGIGPSTIEGTATAGARLFVVGSAIFETPDYAWAIDDLSARAAHGMASSSEGF